MKRALFTLVTLGAILVAGLRRPVVANKDGAGSARLDLIEATIDDLQEAIQRGS